MKQSVIALFVPNLGCPLRCSFCDQRQISGSMKQITERDVEQACEQAAMYLDADEREKAEIAFFGGSFTAIDNETMTCLLSCGKKMCEKFGFAGLRCSTRPDCVSEKTLKILKSYGMKTIEIGCQSLDDYVLEYNHRGHTAKECIDACRRIKEYGFLLGVQMMTGLPGSSKDSDLMTAELLAEEHPDFARIYPALVLEDTEMAVWYKNGDYSPLSVDEAAEMCSEIIPIFEKNGTEVIKVGLNSERSLERSLIAGPYHEAFREICEGKMMLRAMETALKRKEKGNYLISVAPDMVSRTVGHKKENVLLLGELGYNIKVKADSALTGRNFLIDNL